MTSSILSRLEDEIALFTEDGGYGNIVEAHVAPDVMRELMMCVDHERPPPEHHSLQFHSCFGSVTVIVNRHAQENEIYFITEDGEKVHPMDEMINRILLEIE